MSKTQVQEASASSSSPAPEIVSKKRKVDQAELEVDLAAPEPPSKKALRRAKKGKSEPKLAAEADAKPTKAGAADDSTSTQQPKRSAHGIWIGNLSFTTTKEDLLTFITSDADHPLTKEKVTRVHLPLGQPKFGKPQNKGFAYIDFADAPSLSTALELSEKLLTGRRVLIKDANNFEGRPQTKGTAAGESKEEGKPASRRVFIGNLDFNSTVEDLEAHFGVCGNITHTHMATFEDSGKCKGFAWVEFENIDDARKAMRGWVEEGHAAGQPEDDDTGRGKRSGRRIWLHKIAGRQLRMEYAEDKAVRYQKRYGKDAQKAKDESQGRRVNGERSRDEQRSRPADDKETTGEEEKSGTNAGERGAKKRRVRAGGYDEATVNRLTGGIVEPKGNKVTFD